MEMKHTMLFFHQIQLIRIEARVPEYGWTTQKVFHLMNFVVNAGMLIFSRTLFIRHSNTTKCFCVSQSCKFLVFPQVPLINLEREV